MQFFISSDSDSLKQLLDHIVMGYLTRMYCICVLWTNLDVDQVGNINFMEHQVDANYPILIWMKYERSNESRTNVNDLVRLGIENYCQAYIVTPNSAIDFLNSFEEVRYSTMQRYSSTHVIALPTSHIDTENYIKEISMQKSVEDIPNLLIISPLLYGNGTDTSYSSYDLITTRIDNRCDNLNLQYLDIFNGNGNGQFEAHANLFPEKLTDLMGNTLLVSTFNYTPYNIWWEVPAGTGNANMDGSEDKKTLFVDGSEISLVLEFCALYNCTLTIVLDEENSWGTVYDNGTGDGALGNPVQRHSDIGISGLYSWQHEHFFLDLSASYTRSTVTVLCPKPRQLVGWVLITMPLSNIIWLAEFSTIFALIVAVIVTRLIYRKLNGGGSVASISSTWFEILTITLMQGSKSVSQHRPETIILMTSTVSSILIASLYTGQLASITTVPQYEDPIDTNQQYADKKMKWGAWHDAWTTSLQNIPDPTVEYLLNSYETISTESLAARKYSNDFCYPLETLQSGHYAIEDFMSVQKMDYLRLIKDAFYWGHVVTYMYKTWPLKDLYDLHVLNIAQSGLFQKWEYQIVAKSQDMEVDLAISTSRHKDNPAPASLAFDHISGAFILWGTCVCLSTIAFIGEIVMDRFRLHLRMNKIAS